MSRILILVFILNSYVFAQGGEDAQPASLYQASPGVGVAEESSQRAPIGIQGQETSVPNNDGYSAPDSEDRGVSSDSSSYDESGD